MNRLLLCLLSVAVIGEWPASADAQMAQNCANTRIVDKRMPVGPAKFQSGLLTLANGATLQLTGAPRSPSMVSVRRMHIGDRVNACYGPLKSYADAPPSRALTIIDKRTGSYAGGPIGTWPGKMSQ